jgi:SnoaL-like protein
MAKVVKKAAHKKSRANKSGTKKIVPARKSRPTRKQGSGAKPAKALKPTSAARPSKPVARPKVPAPKAAAPKPLAPKAPTSVANETPKPISPRPAPVLSPALQPPPGPKPDLVRLSSLEPGAAARLTAARNLLEAQRRHDLPALLACFGPEPTVEFAGGPRHIGVERIEQIYGDLLRAFPDLALDVLAEHVGNHSIIIELVMHGTHRQQWLGMAPRGRTLTLPVCNIFIFDKRDQISALRIYLDRNLAIVQLTSGLLR